MGAKTKFSASEAADAMNYMAMAGWKTSDLLDGIEGIMNLAAASSNANTNVSMMGETLWRILVSNPHRLVRPFVPS